jgi:hypothetical protein
VITHEINRGEPGPKAGYAPLHGHVVEILDGLVVGIPSAEEMLSKVHAHRLQSEAAATDPAANQSLAVDVEESGEQADDVTTPIRQEMCKMTGQSTEEVGNGSTTVVLDLRTLVLILVTIGMGFLLYLEPAIGAAVLGALTVLSLLTLLIRR